MTNLVFLYKIVPIFFHVTKNIKKTKNLFHLEWFWFSVYGWQRVGIFNTVGHVKWGSAPSWPTQSAVSSPAHLYNKSLILHLVFQVCFPSLCTWHLLLLTNSSVKLNIFLFMKNSFEGNFINFKCFRGFIWEFNSKPQEYHLPPHSTKIFINNQNVMESNLAQASRHF